MRTLDTSLGNNADVARIKARRAAFNRMKKTASFRRWKNFQFRAQHGRCAWCRKKMNSDFSGVHVDHAVALFHEGTNAYRNLVLSHAHCNMEKWIRIDGVPQWIINSKKQHERSLLKGKQKKLFKQLVEANYQEELGNSLKWIT